MGSNSGSSAGHRHGDQTIQPALKSRGGIIYLTGFMASGKSTMGPIVANSIGYSFADLDQHIVRREGRSVAEVFRTEGEEYFRRIESEILGELSAKKGYVISLGGGTILRQENLRRIKETGILIYLQADTDQLVRRLRHKTDRPVLKGEEGEILSEERLRARIETLLASRAEYYAAADITINTDGVHLGRTVDAIVRAVTPYV